MNLVAIIETQSNELHLKRHRELNWDWVGWQGVTHRDLTNLFKFMVSTYGFCISHLSFEKFHIWKFSNGENVYRLTLKELEN